MASLRLAQPAPSSGGSLKARQVWARLAPRRAASRRELCQIGALSRARALPYWRGTWLRASRAFNLMGLGCLLFPRGGSLPRWLCTRLSGGGAGLLQQVLPQGLLPLSWGCGQEPRHAGSGPKHLHMSLLGIYTHAYIYTQVFYITVIILRICILPVLFNICPVSIYCTSTLATYDLIC